MTIEHWTHAHFCSQLSNPIVCVKISTTSGSLKHLSHKTILHELGKITVTGCFYAS